MTEPQDLERYIDDFGHRLGESAAAPATPRFGRRRLVFIGAGAVAAAGIVAALLGGSGERLDPVAEARAALAARGEIVYMKITTRLIAPQAINAPPPQTTEQWSALDPPRWRYVQALPPKITGDGGSRDTRGPGRQEFSYANGVQRTYIASRDALTVNRGYSDVSSVARLPSALGNGSGDLQTDLRSMLVDANVTDQGEREVGGRTVRRLVSEQRSELGSGETTGNPKPGAELLRRLVYDVDPATFAPIQGTLTVTIPSRPRALRLSTRMHVDAYERIPLTAATAKLLRIQTTPRTKVTVRTAKQPRARPERG